MNKARVLVMLAAIVSASPVHAKTLHVALTGNDSVSYAANSEANPWRTIGRALWGAADRSAPNPGEAARAGDTVLVRAGTYFAYSTASRLNPWFNPVNSGTPSAPIAIRTLERAVITSTPTVFGAVQSATAGTIQLDPAASAVDDAYAGWYIRITAGAGAGQARFISQPQSRGQQNIRAGSYDGDTRTAALQTPWTTVPDATSRFALTQPGTLVGTHQRSHVIWDGFTVVEADAYHADTGPLVVWESQNITLLNLEIVGTVLPEHFDNHNGIRLNNSSDVVVRNCVIRGFRPAARTQELTLNNHQNSAAVMTYYTSNVLFENNLIHDAYVGFFPKGGTNVNHVYRFNVIRDCERAFRASFSDQIDITQNVIYDCAEGFQPAEGLSNVRFYNNVVYGGAMGVQNWFATSGFALHNNVIAATAYPQYWEGGHGTFESDRNVYSGYTRFQSGTFRGSLADWRAHSGHDGNSIEGDPLFVNAAGRDFRLRPGSSALAAGRDLYDSDRDGDSAEAIPAGAYITGGETIGPGVASQPVADSAPARPRGMRIF